MKLQAKSLSIKHRKKPDESLKDSDKVPDSNHVQYMKFRKDAHYLDQGIKYIERKIRKSGTSFFTRKNNAKTVKTNNQKVPLEQISMKENTKKIHQTEGSCPLLSDPRIYIDLGKYGDGPNFTAVLDVTYQCPGGTTSAIITFLRQLQIPISASITT